MSYDIYIDKDWVNHTYNGCEAVENIIGFTPKKFNGMKADEVADLCLVVYASLKNNPDKYKKYMSNNGWGTIDSWKHFMLDIIDICNNHPNAIVKVS